MTEYRKPHVTRASRKKRESDNDLYQSTSGMTRADAYKQARESARQLSTAKQQRGPGAGMIATLVVILVLVVSILFMGWYTLVRRTGPVVEPGAEVLITVPLGASAEDIGLTLAKKGVINNEIMFWIQARMQGATALFQAGVHKMVTGAGYDAAIDTLQKPPFDSGMTKVTIIEGLHMNQVADVLAEKVGIDGEKFLAIVKNGASNYADLYPYLKDAYDGSLEGFLFPDTYEFEVGITEEGIVKVMLDRFDQVFKTVKVSKAQGKRYNTNEIVTIASMVEREATLNKERKLVASVINNRIDTDMRLQFCSTVQPLLPKERQNAVRLTRDETWIESPYNTYRNLGLPPGPIANPSKASLQAAANPPKTKYLYFVLTGKDGSQTFTTTYKDHLAAVKKSKEVFGQ